MGLLLAIAGVFAVLLALGALVDRRARREGRRVGIGAGFPSAIRENRRDIRAWERGTHGNTGEDISWMASRHPGR
ncbi:hypothetical protein [Actinomadura rupiterrae]|uniref:hypothetical protein n=1 Tax=Actinomadura rupiterrae TaxID=559627 RepID=UPI0020A27C31|nr:hypothetical protein [Actinomadura rupiterrae]MCP2343280.1 hypothetical protein [Actinomadura rupiterrae]